MVNPAAPRKNHDTCRGIQVAELQSVDSRNLCAVHVELTDLAGIYGQWYGFSLTLNAAAQYPPFYVAPLTPVDAIPACLICELFFEGSGQQEADSSIIGSEFCASSWGSPWVSPTSFTLTCSFCSVFYYCTSLPEYRNEIEPKVNAHDLGFLLSSSYSSKFRS